MLHTVTALFAPHVQVLSLRRIVHQVSSVKHFSDRVLGTVMVFRARSSDHPECEQHVGHHPHDRGAIDEARRRQVRHDEGAPSKQSVGSSPTTPGTILSHAFFGTILSHAFFSGVPTDNCDVDYCCFVSLPTLSNRKAFNLCNFFVHRKSVEIFAWFTLRCDTARYVARHVQSTTILVPFLKTLPSRQG